MEDIAEDVGRATVIWLREVRADEQSSRLRAKGDAERGERELESTRPCCCLEAVGERVNSVLWYS